MTVQEKTKKIFVKHLKQHSDFYNKIKKAYYVNENTRFHLNMLFNTFNPLNILIIISHKISLPRRLSENILIDLMGEIKISYFIVFKNVIRKKFKAKTTQEKEKLYNFCLKYGIIQEYGHSLNYCIYEYSTFFLTNNLTLEYSYSDDCDISLNSFINKFEDIAYKLNGIKINWFKRQIEKLKIRFNL